MNNYVYLAFLDILGTKNFSANAKRYYDNIVRLQERIKDCHALLAQNSNRYKIAFFSDSCYIESKNLEELIDYLSTLRDVLSTRSLFFNAAIIRVDDENQKYKSFEYYNENKSNSKTQSQGIVSGIMFSHHSIARAYIEQNRFKGIGIYLSEDVWKDAKEDSRLKSRVVESIYLEDYTKYDSLTRYYDIACFLYSDTQQACWVTTIVKAYLFACCDNPRYGRYYISLISNIINSASGAIEWNDTDSKFINSHPIYNLLYSIFISKEKYALLTGIDILAIVFINKILSSDLNLNDVEEIINRLLEGVLNKYLTNLDSIPWIAFFGNKENEETFKNQCKTFVFDSKINKLLSE